MVTLSDLDRAPDGSHCVWLWHATDTQATLITGIDAGSLSAGAETSIPVSIFDQADNVLATSMDLLPAGFAPARSLGHGKVFPRPDGYVEPCAGPPACAACAADLSDLKALRLPTTYA